MTVRNLKSLFEPQSVAIIGASQRPHSVGAITLSNMIAGGFAGPILPVNPKYTTLGGLDVFASVAALPLAPDLAVICTPPATVPQLIRELGERGTRAVIVLSAGLDVVDEASGQTLKQLMLNAAKPYLLRILGPNCIGLLVPALGLNASFAHTGALPGNIAFVSQSGALVTGVLDWAKSRGIGFSRFVSLGESADIDFGDLLDYLASDFRTHAILLYIEDIRFARKFMSAARAAARSKPVIVLKAGRVPEGAKAAASHTGALAGADDVYDAAIRRAGMLRVYSTDDLFNAVETLAHARSMSGDRLAIMTNGGGPGVMATDALIEAGGKLAALSAQTIAQLNQKLPATWSHADPVDIIGDAPAERYVQTLETLLKDDNNDAVLIIHAPTAIVSSTEIAAALVPLATRTTRTVMSCWLGGDTVAQARRLFSEAGVPNYRTPEDAVRGFMQIVQYRRNQALLMEVPPAQTTEFTPDRATATALVRNALASGRNLLSEAESKAVLAAYGIPIVETGVAESIDDVLAIAQRIGFPVALKIQSRDISHKSDVGGVELNIETPQALRDAVQAMEKRIRELRPDAALEGFSVQAMVRHTDARELIIGVATDRIFGPVILFGQGGITVEVTADHAIALPPLNRVLARDVVSRTRVIKLLGSYRNCAAADIEAVYRTLVQLSNLVIDLPELVELDINPLLASPQGVIALDARIQVRPAEQGNLERLAIRPYPQELEEQIEWQGRVISLRPIKPEDAAQHVNFFNALDPEDIRFRFFVRMRELQSLQLARMTQIDYDREMAFIAVGHDVQQRPETLGVSRVIVDPDNLVGEFSIIVRSDLKNHGLGNLLMKKLIDYCRSRGTAVIVGEALKQNRQMIRWMRELGFEVTPMPDDDSTMRLQLDLNSDDA